VITSAGDVRPVRDALVAGGVEVESSDVTQLPSNLVPVEEGTARQVLRLIDALDDLDDVQAVYSNYDIDDSVMEKVLAEA
jgi:transcriptional/translational regulatory protein YebC/TACO1